MPTFRAGFALPFEDLRDEFDRLWESLASAPPLHGWGTRQAAGAFPAVNVRETDDAVLVEAELPGLDAESVDISVAEDELVLKGSRPACAADPTDGEKPTATWHRRERGTGTFERRIGLPIAVDATRVEARLANGVLTVTCPKAPQCQPRKVEVRAG